MIPPKYQNKIPIEYNITVSNELVTRGLMIHLFNHIFTGQ